VGGSPQSLACRDHHYPLGRHCPPHIGRIRPPRQRECFVQAELNRLTGVAQMYPDQYNLSILVVLRLFRALASNFAKFVDEGMVLVDLKNNSMYFYLQFVSELVSD
jgi:hypothetical protein